MDIVCALPKEYTFLNYLRCHDDIGWGLDYGTLSNWGMKEVPHKKYLNDYFQGKTEGSVSRGELYNEDPVTGDARFCATTASMCGIESAGFEQDEEKMNWAIEKDLMLHAYMFTQSGIPMLYSGDEVAQVNDYTYKEDPDKAPDSRYIHRGKFNWELAERISEKGDVSNISVDYSMLLSTSFKDKIVELEGYIAGCGDEGKKHYWTLQIRILNSILSLMSRYVEKAREVGNEVVEKTVIHLLSSKPETLLEAMQMMRIIHFTMWAGRNYHNTLGHLDRYLYPFYAHDISKGILSRDSALELLEEFFLSFNRDSDLYPGMQQGDNGQSLVLGGYDEDGNDTYSDFSELCLLASLDLRLIDPKINLRVSKRTPLERYVLGTHMTKQGLGFPQYSNDDVVIPGLENLGYDKEDAASYVVAACWEFIIPGKAMDIPNLEALSFAGAVRRATVENLSSSRTYDEFLAAVDKTIEEDVEKIISSLKPVYIFPSPFLSPPPPFLPTPDASQTYLLRIFFE